MGQRKSTVIRAYSYDKDKKVLAISFISGGLYTYSNVPSPVYEELRKAVSKGEFFDERIREQYPTQKLR